MSSYIFIQSFLHWMSIFCKPVPNITKTMPYPQKVWTGGLWRETRALQEGRYLGRSSLSQPSRFNGNTLPAGKVTSLETCSWHPESCTMMTAPGSNPPLHTHKALWVWRERLGWHLLLINVRNWSAQFSKSRSADTEVYNAQFSQWQLQVQGLFSSLSSVQILWRNTSSSQLLPALVSVDPPME